nr:reverse transcriptase domain-containing protein [Tanacetum cinerariifolium]
MLLEVTQSIKVNGVTDDALHLYLFPHSLTHHATAWFDHLPRNSINTFEQMAKMFLGKYFPPSMVTELRNEITNFRQRPDESLFEAWECHKLSIDRCPNHNMLPVTQIDTFYNGLTLRHRDTINAASAQQSESSSSITSSFDPKIVTLKAEMAKINKNLMRVLHFNQQLKAVTPNCETCGGPHSYNDCLATVGQTQNVYAAGAYQGGNSYQPQVVTTTEFTNYMKANDAILKNMQTNMTSLTNSNLELKNMFGQFIKMNTASSSGSGTLSSNTITNPKEDLKCITTRSGTTYQGPMIPTTSSSLSQVVKRETEVTKDTLPPTNYGSTKDVRPPVVQIETPKPNSEPVVASVTKSIVAPVRASKPNRKPSIPYLSRIHDQKLHDKANDQQEKFFQIFEDLDFNISLADALILMSKFSPTIKSLLTNKDKLPGRSRHKHKSHAIISIDKLSLPELTPTLMTLELTEKTLIDVYEGELTLYVGKEAITFNLDQTLRYSANYNDMTANRIDVIDMAYEEYSDFLLEEVDAFLALEDDATSPKVNHSYFDTEGDIFLLEAFLNDDPSLPPPTQGKYLPQVKLKDLPPHLEYAFLEGDDKFSIIIAQDLSVEEKSALIKDGMYALTTEKSHFIVKEGIVLGHKISKNGIKVDKAKVDVIAKLPHPTTVKGIRSFLEHASFYRRFIQDFSKIARPMTRLLEKYTPFFSKECVEAFQTLKKKLTEAPILIAPDWDLPFELICDAIDFSIGVVQGQRHEKHFRHIHYASKIMTEAESHYTTTEKEMLAMVYAFKKF